MNSNTAERERERRGGGGGGRGGSHELGEGERPTSIDESMESPDKDCAVWVQPWGGAADGVGVRESPGNDLDLLISDTTAGDLEVVLGCIHRVMCAVEK